MKSIVMLSGPALGHISRLISIADNLDPENHKVTFLIPDVSGSAGIARAAGYDVVSVPVRQHGEDLLRRAEAFADEVEAKFAEIPPDVIVQDLSPVQWTWAMRWPRIPRIVVSNAFILGYFNSTVQNSIFAAISTEVNRSRQARGLPLLDSYRPLYQGDLTCFTDPAEVAAVAEPLPKDTLVTGPCFWHADVPLPAELEGLEGHVVISMGSTGRGPIDEEALDQIARFAGTKDIVYAGANAEEISKLAGIRYASKLLPLEKVLEGAKLAVVQGGSGSTYQALSMGLPLVVIPWHRNHQSLGDILEQLGAAICLRDERPFDELAHADIEKMTSAAQEIATSMRTQKGSEEIARHIAAMADGSSSVTSAAQELDRNLPGPGHSGQRRRFALAANVPNALRRNPEHEFALGYASQIYATDSVYTIIPKNGCSSIRFAIARANGILDDLDQIHWIHSNNQTFSPTTEAAFKARYTFVVLRCPFSRIASAFLDKIVNFDNQAWSLYNESGRRIHPHDITFVQFLQEIARAPARQRNPHWRCQKDFLLYKKYDDVFRIEEMGSAWPVIEEKAGLQPVDTREKLGHHTGQLEQVDWPGAGQEAAFDLLAAKRQGRVPMASSLLTGEALLLARNLFAPDLELYHGAFGNSKLMDELGW